MKTSTETKNLDCQDTIAIAARHIALLLEAGDNLEPYAREHASGMSEQLADEWRKIADQLRTNHDRAEAIIEAREKTIERLQAEINLLRDGLHMLAYWSRSKTETRITLRDRIQAMLSMT